MKLMSVVPLPLRGGVLAAGLLAAMLASSVSAAPPASNDEVLASEVKQALEQDRRIDADEITVEATADGRVELAGWANDPEDVRQALYAASKVPGVRVAHSRVRTWSNDE